MNGGGGGARSSLAFLSFFLKYIYIFVHLFIYWKFTYKPIVPSTFRPTPPLRKVMLHAYQANLNKSYKQI